jgi:anti-sigma regulatory factor (Ser/Thr protein kinase)
LHVAQGEQSEDAGDGGVTAEPVVSKAQWSLRHIVLDADASSVRQARRFITDVAGADAQVADTAVLLTSELVTNAVLHADGPITVQAGWDRNHRLRVEVVDSSPAVPRVRRRGQDAMTGRGLMLVETMSVAWGAERRSRGKAVWFVLDGSTAERPADEERALHDSRPGT